MHEGSVETPGETLGEGGRGHLGGPVVVARVAVGGEAVLGEGLHQTVELRPEPLPEVSVLQQVPLSLPPLRPPVLEPNLNQIKNKTLFCGEHLCVAPCCVDDV